MGVAVHLAHNLMRCTMIFKKKENEAKIGHLFPKHEEFFGVAVVEFTTFKVLLNFFFFFI